MARYIDLDKAIPTAIQACVDVVGHGITQVDAVNIALKFEEIATADVVPKGEVERVYYNLQAVLEERAETKREIAMEIFEEIDKKVKASITIHLEEINKEHIQDTPLYDRHSGIIFALRFIEDFIAELKKKYTGEQSDG